MYPFLLHVHHRIFLKMPRIRPRQLRVLQGQTLRVPPLLPRHQLLPELLEDAIRLETLSITPQSHRPRGWINIVFTYLSVCMPTTSP